MGYPSRGMQATPGRSTPSAPPCPDRRPSQNVGSSGREEEEEDKNKKKRRRGGVACRPGVPWGNTPAAEVPPRAAAARRAGSRRAHFRRATAAHAQAEALGTLSTLSTWSLVAGGAATALGVTLVLIRPSGEREPGAEIGVLPLSLNDVRGRSFDPPS